MAGARSTAMKLERSARPYAAPAAAHRHWPALGRLRQQRQRQQHEEDLGGSVTIKTPTAVGNGNPR